MSKPTETELMEFLRGKLAEAEKSLHYRESASICWRSDDDAQWDAASKMTGIEKMNKIDRLRIADRQERIAETCRREVEMFRAVIEYVISPSDQPATLWCNHIIGMDEVQACRDRAHAELVAKQFNEFAEGRADANEDPVMRAEAIPWPHDAASHTEDIARWNDHKTRP